jgi:molybdopterin-containing oxidoreductase family membrane subunit
MICSAIIVGVWIHKGLGLVVPGLIPSPLGDITEYAPTLPEILIVIGVWAFGVLLVTLLYRIALYVKAQAVVPPPG